MNAKDFAEKQGKKLKDTTKVKPVNDFDKLKADEKWALVKQLLIDLKYIDK